METQLNDDLEPDRQLEVVSEDVAPRISKRPSVEIYEIGQAAGSAVFSPPFGGGAWSVVLAADVLGLLSPLAVATSGRLTLLGFAITCIFLLHQAGLYRSRLHLSVLDDLPTLAGRAILSAVGVGVLVSILDLRPHVTNFAQYALGAWLLLILLRFAAYRIIGAVRARGGATHRALFLGGGLVAAQLATLLLERPQYGLLPVGFLDVDPLIDPAGEGPMAWLGELRDLSRVLAEQHIRVLIVAFGNLPESAMIDVLRSTNVEGCEVFIVPRLYEAYRQHGAYRDHIGAIPVQRVERSPRQGPTWRLKRSLDIVMACLGLFILTPILALVALAVRLEGGAGVLFRQVRVGRDGRHFELLKFRSMRPANATEAETNWNVAADKRIGPVGRFIRRSSLDELPQLFNILRGDMSLVGPRPERPFFVDRFSAVHPRYFHRHRVPCGLTGMAQVNGFRGDTSIADRVRYDNYYIENWSLWLDFKILLLTAREVLGARGR